MAFAHYLLAVPVEPCEYPKLPISNPPLSISSHCLNLSSTLRPKTHNLSLFSRLRRIAHKGRIFHLFFPCCFFIFRKSLISAFAFGSANAKPQEPEVSVASDAFTEFKHLLLPITDRNPYLSEGTRQVGRCDALQFSFLFGLRLICAFVHQTLTRGCCVFIRLLQPPLL
ncbi:hypothetical protein V8G54_002537 [Vigna mungo]|uniref:Uncharacterized protein n=1 Tax=Vigna mungo TaxID=3915 RepID=A0AAQ3PCD4_VIGMU